MNDDVFEVTPLVPEVRTQILLGTAVGLSILHPMIYCI